MKKVKTEYPVYVDVNRFFIMNRTDPNTKGGEAIKYLNLEINEDYIKRSPLPAPQSQFKEIYFGDREHDNFFFFLVEKPEVLILFDQWLRFGLASYIDTRANLVFNMYSDIADADILLYRALRKAGFVL